IVPSVVRAEPREWSSEFRTADGSMELTATAKDDFALVGAQLVIDRVKREGTAESAPTADKGKGHWVVDLVTSPKPVNGEFGAPVVAPGATFTPGEGTAEIKSFTLGYHCELAALPEADLKAG